MLTCCPGCETTFRVTPEQLKARAGKVRCGKCQAVFNALDTLVEAAPAAVPVAEPPPSPTSAADPAKNEEVALIAGETAHIATASAVNDSENPTEVAANAPTDPEPGALPEMGSAPEALAEPELAAEPEPPTEPAPPAEPEPLSPEAVRDTALAAGLVAARETTEVPGYNKWAEGAFAAPVSLSSDAPAVARWPFVVAGLLLVVALAGQVAHHFRAELAVGVPSLRPVLEALGAVAGSDIPLPRHAELVSIEASDLQADPAQGGPLILSATLKNRAPYAQSWPLLEITLTDVQDNALLRRVLPPADYLPAGADPTVFPPNGETGLRLWLEAKGVSAAGYRLYVFYP